MEPNFGEKVFAYSFYAISILSIIISLAFGGAVLALLAAIFSFLSVLYLYSGKIINNIIIKNTHALVVARDYQLGGNLYSAFRRKGNVFESVSVAVLVINSPLSNQSFAFEQLLSRVKVPFEYSIEMKEFNRKRLVEDLETKLHMKEIELANAESSKPKEVNRIKREIGVIEDEIKALSSGSTPFDVKFKIRCRYESSSLLDAVSTSQKNAEYVATLFSNIFNAGYILLKGEELLGEV